MAIQSASGAAPRTHARAAKSEAQALRDEPPARETHRAPAREQVTSGYFDREGNPLTRKNPTFRNEYDFQPGEVPEGWAYQWIRHTVHGDPSESELFSMQENGWRPVPHERHKNRFAPTFLEGKACITRRGQLLVERPVGMNVDAERAQKREADAQIGDQFKRFAVPLPDNVRAMGLQGRDSIANRQTEDVGQVRGEFMPKRELAIE
jgi:hypothetical protein